MTIYEALKTLHDNKDRGFITSSNDLNLKVNKFCGRNMICECKSKLPSNLTVKDFFDNWEYIDEEWDRFIKEDMEV